MSLGLKRETTATGALTTGLIAEAVSGVSAGQWLFVGGIAPLCVTLEGDFVGTAHVLVSNSPPDQKPADADNDCPQVGADLSGRGIRTAENAHNWVKLRVSARTSGTITRAGVVAGKALA